MKIRSSILAVLFAFVLYASKGVAVTLSLEPPAQDIAVGSTTTVDLTISELGDGVAPSLGAFFVEILFDDSILSLDSVVYGTSLGNPDPLAFETDILTTTGMGSVSLDEISFLFGFELDALQSDAFILATLTFTGDVAGASALTFGTVDLADAAFPSNTITPEVLLTASITVLSDDPPGIAPTPGGMLLLLSGFLAFGVLTKNLNLRLRLS